MQIPGYLEHQAALKAAGVEEVMVFCVNDGAVMTAWGKEMMIEDTKVTFMADTRMETTKALGLELAHPGPMGLLGNTRCKRFAMYLDDGVIKVINVSEAEDDPAGDDKPESSCIENMLKEIAAL